MCLCVHACMWINIGAGGCERRCAGIFQVLSPCVLGTKADSGCMYCAVFLQLSLTLSTSHSLLLTDLIADVNGLLLILIPAS